MLPVVGYNPLPDEKGTERSMTSTSHLHVVSYNPLPDEKGTERIDDLPDAINIIKLQSFTR